MYGRILQDPNADFSDSGVEATVFVTSPLGSGSNWEAGMGVHFNYAGGVQIYMGLDETNNKAKARILHRGNVMATAERSGISAGWYWIELSFTYQESSDTVSFYVTRVGQYPEEGPILFGEINLGDLGIGAGDTVTRMVVFMKADSGNPLSKFDDVSLKVFNTDPAPGTYTYDYGSSVTVTAIPDDGYVFYYWILDGATVYDNPINVTMDSDHDLEAYFAEPVCAMKTLTDGDFYVPNATSLLKIEKLFDDSGIEGDQTGGSSPYETISDYPDGIVDMADISFLIDNFMYAEGDDGWHYMADVNGDKQSDMADITIACDNYLNSGTYITDLSGVTVTFDTDEVLEPENGYVTIPSGAANFTVKQDGNPIGAMIIFW